MQVTIQNELDKVRAEYKNQQEKLSKQQILGENKIKNMEQKIKSV